MEKKTKTPTASVNTPISFHLDFSLVEVCLADLKQVWVGLLPGGDRHQAGT